MKNKKILITTLSAIGLIGSTISFANESAQSTAPVAPVAVVKPIAKITPIRVEIEDGEVYIGNQEAIDAVKSCNLKKDDPVFVVYSHVSGLTKTSAKIVSSSGEIISTNHGLHGLCSFIGHAVSIAKADFAELNKSATPVAPTASSPISPASSGVGELTKNVK